MNMALVPKTCENCYHWISTDDGIGECENRLTNEKTTMAHDSCSLHEHDCKRHCHQCGTVMVEGYCIEGGLEYYCSDECLEKNMTRDEFLSLYDDGNGDSYYTDWEDDGDE